MARSFWLTNGRRVDLLAYTESGDTIASVTSEPDPDIPEPLPATMDDGLALLAQAAAVILGIEYTCTYPTCVARAARMGWPRAYHKANTKIGREHLSYRKEGS